MHHREAASISFGAVFVALLFFVLNGFFVMKPSMASERDQCPDLKNLLYVMMAFHLLAVAVGIRAIRVFLEQEILAASATGPQDKIKNEKTQAKTVKQTLYSLMVVYLLLISTGFASIDRLWHFNAKCRWNGLFVIEFVDTLFICLFEFLLPFIVFGTTVLKMFVQDCWGPSKKRRRKSRAPPLPPPKPSLVSVPVLVPELEHDENEDKDENEQDENEAKRPTERVMSRSLSLPLALPAAIVPQRPPRPLKQKTMPPAPPPRPARSMSLATASSSH